MGNTISIILHNHATLNGVTILTHRHRTRGQLKILNRSQSVTDTIAGQLFCILQRIENHHSSFISQFSIGIGLLIGMQGSVLLHKLNSSGIGRLSRKSGNIGYAIHSSTSHLSDFRSISRVTTDNGASDASGAGLLDLEAELTQQVGEKYTLCIGSGQLRQLNVIVLKSEPEYSSIAKI